ncbi:molybdopterin-dependent oxidoreductase [Lacipirellula limnantheis]|uniref:Formate dehydrogenase n=1 Tax=Lacipirellula limnantheis TaxID=2528024 RepID=A0A517TZV8_9BACT|nr:molybdopterin-dependent oxidoreductase [Lacipirellula limnantheis]QDT73920.1 Putative formate dehydrogenase [Lacipirellula limnantheis]
MRKVKTGGGWPALLYTLRKGREAGGIWQLWKAMRSKNACKTCALGMGGQRGGMVNEAGHFPEVCKKSLQAMVADMQGAITPDFWAKYGPDELRGLSPRELETCGRLTQPVLYTTELKRYQPISWEEAYSRIVGKLRELTPDETFWYFSGRSSNEAGFLLQMFARLYGTNNVNNCSYYCHQASGVGLTSVTGSGTATVTLEDVEKADLVFVIGGNPASNHPRLMRSLMSVRRAGGEVVVINPILETGLVNFSVPSDVRSMLFGTKIASLYIQPHIGGDLALLTGICKQIVETKAHDVPFLENNCNNWDELRDWLATVTWEEIIAKSGVPRAEIDEIAKRYAKAKNVVFSWTMGITHHVHGVENVQAIGNLALLRGMVGKPGAGLMPIRGHSNVQGIGSVGVTPKLKDVLFDRLQSHFGVTLPTSEGRDTMACMEGADNGELKFGLCLGGNLYGSNPDSTFAQQALEKLDTLVYLSTTLNTGHAFGLAKETIILPVLARDEEPQATTQESMFNYIRLSDGGPARHAGPKSEVEVIASIAAGVAGFHDRSAVAPGSAGGLNPHNGAESNGAATPGRSPGLHYGLEAVNWRSMQDTGRIRDAIAAIVPGYEQIAEIDKNKQEFQVGGRTFHQANFPTYNGRANLHTHQLPAIQGTGERELRLMTIRSEGQFNTVVYEDYDLYRGVERRDVILLHPDDIRRLHVDASMTVAVHGPAGTLRNVRIHPFEEIRPGNAAMYYPEANVLVSRHLDPSSKTPAFKCVIVRLEAEGLALAH